MEGRDRLYSTLSTQLALNSNRDLKRFESDIERVVGAVLSELRNNQKFRGLINKLVVQRRVAAAEAFLSQKTVGNSQADPPQNDDKADGNLELHANSESEIVEKHWVLPSFSSEADINEKSVTQKLSNGYDVKFKYIKGDIQPKSSELNKNITKDWTMVVILPNVVLETNEFDIVKITAGCFEQLFTILSQANLHKKTKNIVLALAPKYFKKSSKAREILSSIISYDKGFEGEAKLFVTGFINNKSIVQPKEYCEELRKFNYTAEELLEKHGIQFLDLKKFLPIKLNGVDWHKDHPETPEVFNDDIMAWVLKEAMSYAMLSASGSMKRPKRVPVEQMENDEKEIDQSGVTIDKSSSEDDNSSKLSLCDIDFGPDINGNRFSVTYKTVLKKKNVNSDVVALDMDKGPKWILLVIGEPCIPVSNDGRFSSYWFNFGSVNATFNYMKHLLEHLKVPKNIVISLNPAWYFKIPDSDGKIFDMPGQMSLLSELGALAVTPSLHDIYFIGYPTEPWDNRFCGRLKTINNFMTSEFGDRFIDPYRFITPEVSKKERKRPNKNRPKLLEDELNCFLMKEAMFCLMNGETESTLLKQNDEKKIEIKDVVAPKKTSENDGKNEVITPHHNDYGPKINGKRFDVTYKTRLKKDNSKPEIVASELEKAPKWILLVLEDTSVPSCKDRLFSAFMFNLGSVRAASTFVIPLLRHLKAPKNIVISLNPAWFFRGPNKTGKAIDMPAEMMSLLELDFMTDRSPFCNVYFIGYPTDPPDEMFNGRLKKINDFMASKFGDHFIDPYRFIPPALPKTDLTRPNKNKPKLLDDELNCFLLKEAMDYLMKGANGDVIVRDYSSDEEIENFVVSANKEIKEEAKKPDEKVEEIEEKIEVEEKKTEIGIVLERKDEEDVIGLTISLKDTDHVEKSVSGQPLKNTVTVHVENKRQENERDRITATAFTTAEKMNTTERKLRSILSTTLVCDLKSDLFVEPSGDMGRIGLEAVFLRNTLNLKCGVCPEHLLAAQFNMMKLGDKYIHLLHQVVAYIFARINGFFKKKRNSITDPYGLGEKIKAAICRFMDNYTLRELGVLLRPAVVASIKSDEFSPLKSHEDISLMTNGSLDQLAHGAIVLGLFSALFPDLDAPGRNMEDFFFLLERLKNKFEHIHLIGRKVFRPLQPSFVHEIVHETMARRLKERIESEAKVVPDAMVGLRLTGRLRKRAEEGILQTTLNVFARYEPFFKQDVMNLDDQLVGKMVKTIATKMCKCFGPRALGNVFRQEMDSLLTMEKFKSSTRELTKVLDREDLGLGVYALKVWEGIFIKDEGLENDFELVKVDKLNAAQTEPITQMMEGGPIKKTEKIDEPATSKEKKKEESEYCKLMREVRSTVVRLSPAERKAKSTTFLFQMTARKVGFAENYKKKITDTSKEKDEDFRRVKDAIRRLFVGISNNMNYYPLSSAPDHEIPNCLQVVLNFCVKMLEVEITGDNFRKAIVKCQPTVITDTNVNDILKMNNNFLGGFFFELVTRILMPDKDDTNQKKVPSKKPPSCFRGDGEICWKGEVVKRIQDFEFTPELRLKVLGQLSLMDNIILARKFIAQFHRKDTIFTDVDHDLLYRIIQRFNSFLRDKTLAFNEEFKLGSILKDIIPDILRKPGVVFKIFVEELDNLQSERSTVELNMNINLVGRGGIISYWTMFLCALVDDDVAKQCINPLKPVSSVPACNVLSSPPQPFLQEAKLSKAKNNCILM